MQILSLEDPANTHALTGKKDNMSIKAAVTVLMSQVS